MKQINTKNHQTIRADIDFFVKIFAKRKARNPRYSLRAFARDCGVSVTSISQYLSEKRLLSLRNIEKICNRIKLSEVETRSWIQLHEEYRRKMGLGNTRLKLPSYKFLNDIRLEVIGDWKSLGILTLFQNRKNWSIEELVIHSSFKKAFIKKILRNLERIGMIECNPENSSWRLIEDSNLASSCDIPSKKIQDYHRSILQYSTDKIKNVPLDRRDFGSMIMNIDPRKIPKAKIKIRNFRRKLCAFLEDGEKSEVFIFNQQLFPLFEKKKKESKS